MVPDSRVIDIVGQTNDELMTGRDGRNFEQRNGMGDDQFAQKRDLQIESWDARVLERLPPLKEIFNFREEIKTEAHADAIRRGELEPCAFSIFGSQNGPAGPGKDRTISVDGDTIFFERENGHPELRA